MSEYISHIQEKWERDAPGFRVLLTNKYNEEKHLLNFINSDGTEVSLFSKGNISVISGKPKSKKSFLCTLFAAHMLSKEISSERVRTNFEDLQGRIIYFDTEQSGADCQKIIQRLKYRGVDEDRFILYKLRELETKERLDFIEKAIRYTKNIDVVVIDGARDLVRSINSEEEATDVANLFMKWTEMYNIHLMTVLHQNKSDENLRGHIGSELQNKAESVFEIKKGINPNQSQVKMNFSRRLEAEPFGIEVNTDGVPFLTGEIVTHQKKQKNSEIIAGFTKNELVQFADEAFKEFQDCGANYSNSIAHLKVFMKSINIPLGDNAIKTLFTRMTTENVVGQHSGTYFILPNIDSEEPV